MSEAGGAVYAARRFVAGDPWQIGKTRLKAYAITRGSAPLSAQFWDGARNYCEACGEIINAGNDNSCLGYTMVHHGEQAIWLLAHWWAHGDIAMRLLASAPTNGPAVFRSRDDDRFHACVWEHVIINHERDAWVTHVMRPEPDVQAYLSDTLADGWY